MFSICKNFIRVNDHLFVVKRSFKEDRVLNVDLAKELLNAQHVFKKDDMLYFTEEVEDLQIITEEEQ